MLPRVKICGVCRPQDAERAIALGAWALGLIFFDGSPRRCPDDAATVIAAAARRRVELCGVFVNAPLEEIVARADALALTLVQLHGDEGPAYAAEVARRTGCRVIKASAVSTRADLQALAKFHVDFHLLDAAVEGLRGGTGQRFDWALAAAHRGSIPVILSGGLTADNVATAIATSSPWAVDSASGTETAPGIKDHDRLERFFAAVAGPDPVGEPAQIADDAPAPAGAP